MSDDIDCAQDRQRIETESAIRRVQRRAEIRPGIAGECSHCGETYLRLVNGACARCRDKYGLE